MFKDYLIQYHKNDILDILIHRDVTKHYSVTVNFTRLFETDTELGNQILQEPETVLNELDKSLLESQCVLAADGSTQSDLIEKTYVHVRVTGLPACPELHRLIFPRNEDIGRLLQVTGTVIRITAAKMLEYQRKYKCTKCKKQFMVPATYEQYYTIQQPRKCIDRENCNSTTFAAVNEIDSSNCKDYQEIKMQEQISKIGVGLIPNSMWVTLEDDLVDCCKPGDEVTICGVVLHRWKTPSVGKKISAEVVLKANHVQVHSDSKTVMSVINRELRNQFAEFWNQHGDEPLVARDIILSSICPQVYGLYLVKLAVALILAGGSKTQKYEESDIHRRAEPHLLLVGDPGTGKSQLLRFVSQLVPRSVLTTGVGSTSAGLTVSAFMENGEWQLEGGALVLADGGICCIDEFNSMREHDRASIHEAMEQQSISVAKASIVCKLSTRCSVIAATNPKGKLDLSQPISMNVSLAGPLLSRFDLVLLLQDSRNFEWDRLVSEYILQSETTGISKTECAPWGMEMLQAYFKCIKTLQPVLTPEANAILGSYYQAQRQTASRNIARTTVRLLDSLVRLSQGHARLMFRTEVTTMDAIVAVTLIESSMQGAALFLPNDTNTVTATFPTDPTKTYEQTVKLILSKLNMQSHLDGELKRLTKPESSDVTSENEMSDLDMAKFIKSVKDADFGTCTEDTADSVEAKSTAELDEKLKELRERFMCRPKRKSILRANSTSKRNKTAESSLFQSDGDIDTDLDL